PMAARRGAMPNWARIWASIRSAMDAPGHAQGGRTRPEGEGNQSGGRDTAGRAALEPLRLHAQPDRNNNRDGGVRCIMISSKPLLAITLSAAAILAAPHWLTAKPITYRLPDETAQLKPGPNLDVA